jgi:hypothetical protein
MCFWQRPSSLPWQFGRLPVFSHGLYAPQNTFDFGTVKSSSIVQHTFTVTNLHPCPLRSREYLADVAAHVAPEPQDAISPTALQSVQLDARLDTWGKRESVRETIKLTTQNEVDDLHFVLQGTARP